MEEKVKMVSDLEEGKFYKIQDLQSILKNKGLLHSIYTIRDYETWKCTDYKCGHRHNDEVPFCTVCGGKVRAPLVASPRTLGGGRGPGHRRYTKEEIKTIVDTFAGTI